MAERYLLADVGGTHTRVGLGSAQGFDPESTQPFRNAAYDGLAAVLTDYCARHPGPVTALCAGVAGPVRNGASMGFVSDFSIRNRPCPNSAEMMIACC